jgi:hypothetical protein
MNYKEKCKGDKVDSSIGFISSIYIEFEGNSKIEIFDNISFVNEDNSDYEKIIKEIKKEKNLPEGIFLIYELPKELSIETNNELSDRVENVARAIRFLKKADCEYVFHADCYNKSLYEPSLNSNKSYSRKSITKIIEKDFKRLNKLFIKLESLKLQDFGEYNRLKNAINFYDKACFDGGHLSSLVNFFISLESLFSDDEKTEIAYKIRLRTAYLNYPQKNEREERKKVFDLIKEGYRIRSLFLHGGDVKSDSKIKKKGSYSYLEEYIPEIKDIVRKTIKEILLDENHYSFFSNDKGSGSKKIVDHLDLVR